MRFVTLSTEKDAINTSKFLAEVVFLYDCGLKTLAQVVRFNNIHYI